MKDCLVFSGGGEGCKNENIGQKQINHVIVQKLQKRCLIMKVCFVFVFLFGIVNFVYELSIHSQSEDVLVHYSICSRRNEGITMFFRYKTRILEISTHLFSCQLQTQASIPTAVVGHAQSQYYNVHSQPGGAPVFVNTTNEMITAHQMPSIHPVKQYYTPRKLTLKYFKFCQKVFTSSEISKQ